MVMAKPTQDRRNHTHKRHTLQSEQKKPKSHRTLPNNNSEQNKMRTLWKHYYQKKKSEMEG